MSDDSLDPELDEQFDRLQEAEAPDLWERISSGIDTNLNPDRMEAATISSTDITQHKPSRWVFAAVAALLVAVAFIGVSALFNRGDDAAIDLGNNDPVSTTVETTTAAKKTDTEPPENELGNTLLPPSDNCISAELASSLAQGMPMVDYDPSESLAELVGQSPIIARGQVIEATESDGGSIVLVKTFETVGPQAENGPRVINLWTPATIAPDGWLGGNFVAFLTGNLLAHPTDGDPLWTTQLEGFWVDCGLSGPAASVLVDPIADGWDDIKRGGVTLDQLWQVALFPDGSHMTPIGEPTHSVDGVDVFDLRLIRGERFRLSLPQGLADGASLGENPSKPGATITGPNMRLEIGYGFCVTPYGLELNALGSEVRISGSSVNVCRSEDLIAMSVELLKRDPATPDPAAANPDSFDIRPIVPTGPYGEKLNEFRPEVRGCSNCDPNGPAVYSALNLVVNRTGHTSFTAVALDTLIEVWTFDTEGFGAQMYSGSDVVYFFDSAGPLVKVDAATGAELWRNVFAEEHLTRISRRGSGALLLATSFSTEGDSRAPLIRRIDERSGEVLWTGAGREWGEWQGGRITVMEGTAILMDTLDNPSDPNSGPGGLLLGFDMGTGERLWTVELDVGAGLFGSNFVSVADFENDQALLARTVDGQILRVDPVTGEVIWQTRIGAIEVDGTEFASDGKLSISVQTPSGQQLLNPETGAISR